MREQLRRHPGRLAVTRWEAWRFVEAAANTNQRELLDLIEEPDRKHDMAIAVVRNVGGDGFDRLYFGDLYRRLHNYMASVATLVDHTRKHLAAYEGLAVKAEYDTRVKALQQEPVVPFMKDLRNVLLHSELPTLSVTYQIGEPGQSSFAVNLQRDGLLEIHRITKAARAYLGLQPEEFPLRQPIEEYHALVDALNDWIGGQFAALHADDLADHNALAQEMESMRFLPEEEG